MDTIVSGKVESAYYRVGRHGKKWPDGEIYIHLQSVQCGTSLFVSIFFFLLFLNRLVKLPLHLCRIYHFDRNYYGTVPQDAWQESLCPKD